jgi:hypothetical protein
MLTFPFFDGSIHRLPVTTDLSGLERVEAMPQRKAVVTIAIVDDHPIVLDGLDTCSELLRSWYEKYATA